MSLRDDFLRRIQKKQAEIEGMRTNLRIEERYLEALQDAYKLLPRAGEESNGSRATGFRKGSGVAKAYEALKRTGHTMHIKDLVEEMGLKANRANTQGLASSLRSYVLKGEVFTKPAPNTYGLIEFGETAAGGSSSPDE